MKPALLGTVVGAAIATAALSWSCTVNRQSDQFKCSGNQDCPADRVCTQGYCVSGMNPLFDAPPRPIDAAVCPTVCQGTCDFQARTCTITGTGSGNIACPANWNCNIVCASAGACGTITCSNAASCDIDCTSADACLGITCNEKDCKVDCTGVNACGNISCTSGDCNATCTGADACGTISCGTGDCTANCSGGAGSAACGNINCNGGDCVATCDGSAACGSINCSGNSGSCTSTCMGGSAACGTITCSGGPCQTTCLGSGAGTQSSCSAVNCSNSCQCDVMCDATTNICPTMACPDRAPGSDYCTVNGSNGQRCSSTFATQCNNC